MPNLIDSTGLQTKTRDELLAEMIAAFQSIYGANINLSQDTPDGQMINIFIQSYLDLLDLVRNVYSSFDPDNAIGVTLDQRAAFNGIQRQAGTKTVTNITVVTTQPLSLYGLDQTTNDIYTVADNAGNEWNLITSIVIGAAGSYVLAFSAALPGARLTIPNTITTAKTIVLGVSTINNPTVYTTLGINEETDQQLRLRRRQSVSLSSQGFLAGLLAALENINGIVAAFIYENVQAGVDIDGVPGHSIWVIVSGTATPSEIANAIYKKRNAGCGMFGDQSYVVTQIDGTFFTVRWDYVTPEDLYIKFTVTSLDGITPPNIALIRSSLAIQFIPGVHEQVNINDLATLVQSIDNNTLVTGAGFGLSSGGTFYNTLIPTTKKNQFSINSSNIIITPMQLTPVTVILASLGTQQFTPLGGFGALTYSMDSNPSGGSVSITGLYTAGAGTGVDVIRVTDSLGNYATSAATVT